MLIQNLPKLPITEKRRKKAKYPTLNSTRPKFVKKKPSVYLQDLICKASSWLCWCTLWSTKQKFIPENWKCSVQCHSCHHRCNQRYISDEILWWIRIRSLVIGFENIVCFSFFHVNLIPQSNHQYNTWTTEDIATFYCRADIFKYSYLQ